MSCPQERFYRAMATLRAECGGDAVFDALDEVARAFKTVALADRENAKTIRDRFEPEIRHLRQAVRDHATCEGYTITDEDVDRVARGETTVYRLAYPDHEAEE